MGDKKLLSLLLFSLSLPAQALQPVEQTTLLVGVGADKPPFILSNAETISGLEVDIFREAMAGSGYQLEFVALPFHQLNRALLLFPDLDVAAGVGTEFFDKLHYVDQFSYYENVAISKAAANVKLESVRDLQQYSVVSWQGASQPATPLGSVFHYLYDAADRQTHQGYQELSQYSQNAMFWLGRTDVIVVDRAIFSWYRRLLADSKDTSAEVRIHQLFPERQYTRVAFRDPELAALFAAGLEQLKASGRYQQLYQHYLD
ncbi:transporter substrate-binding domain-containing protein [Alkalimonas sp. MEB108]|uniref:Transporter substrate-binding domain-containing protein n=1 Tax=Alkalimonas cellulosilytica TaxID=3058395 RepID=A0ABU7JBF7_9GAMM|nr:transporter substrate-binding domain-containing protein [Alkalimonas sp. MEB108]MEE2003215.1 transporter substrate-binding domain-containing protein [Alkalimonas sp. MEB108]